MKINIPVTDKEAGQMLRDRNDLFLCASYKESYKNWDTEVREYLLENNPPSPRILNYLTLRLHPLENTVPFVKNSGDVEINKSEQMPYECIPLYMGRFIEDLQIASKIKPRKNPRDIKFIDAGCGVGDKTAIASFFGFNAYGVDYSSFYIECCRAFKGDRFSEDKRFMLGDITTFNFSGYNIIYAYNPMQTVEGMYKFFDNVFMTADPETICIFENVGTGQVALNKMKNKFAPIPKTERGFYTVNKEKK